MVPSNPLSVVVLEKAFTVQEKGGLRHKHKNTGEGLAAIKDYLKQEWPRDFERWRSLALFFSPAVNAHGNGQLNPRVGKHLIEKTGNIAAVQRQLGHKNAAYSMQYARITDEEQEEVLENRRGCWMARHRSLYHNQRYASTTAFRNKPSSFGASSRKRSGACTPTSFDLISIYKWHISLLPLPGLDQRSSILVPFWAPVLNQLRRCWR
jgi:hypothetical protein